MRRAIEDLKDSIGGGAAFPCLLTADDMAALLRTSRKGVYAMVERGLIPGVVHIGRRVLFDRDVVVHWLRQKCSAPSPRG